MSALGGERRGVARGSSIQSAGRRDPGRPGRDGPGTAVSSPVVLAPTAVQRLAHEEGEIATTHGAAAVGALMVLSSLASCSLEEVAAAAPAHPGGCRCTSTATGRTVDLVGAPANAYATLVLTVDTPVSDSACASCVAPSAPPRSEPARRGRGRRDRAHDGGLMAVVTRDRSFRLTPDDIDRLAGLSNLPVVVKGVQRADDAVRCVEAGAAAVVVSNHGARQLADAPPTAEIVGEIADAVGDRAEVYVDGGIRRAPTP